jgi:RNA polymerase sigma factor (sigma-70 family)
MRATACDILEKKCIARASRCMLRVERMAPVNVPPRIGNMATGQSKPLAQQLDRLWNSGTVSGLSDAELLRRYNGSKDQAAEQAFEALLHRHGPMVMGVCRHILSQAQDADDAFQATFLILIRKSHSIRVDTSLAPWLYGVAYRTATRVRANASRRRLDPMQDLEAAPVEPMGEVLGWEIRPMLHEELNRLPEKYRAPIVLCHLEGKSYEEAAQMLHWPVGTVSGRLSRGRQLLKSRLERRGLTASAGMLAAPFLGDKLSTSLPAATVLESTLAAASRLGTAQTVSTSVLQLTQGVLNAMLMHKLKIASVMVLSLGTFAVGAGVLYRVASADSKRDSGPLAEEAQAPLSPPTPEKAFGKASQAVDPLANQSGGPPPIMNPFSRMKNVVHLNTDRSNPIPVLTSGSIMVVESADGTGWEAMERGQGDRFQTDTVWKKLTVPPGIKATPVVAESTLALVYQGKQIEEVAAFAGQIAGWSTQRLRKPVQDDLVPIVGPHFALYQAGNDLYAFSSAMGRWDVLSLPEGAKLRIDVGPDIMVLQDNILYVFNIVTGKWSKGVAIKLPNKLNARPAQ